MCTVVYLDDDDDDIFLFKKAIKEIGSADNIIYISESSELFQVLADKIPELIFLDYDMPGKNGIDCLKEIRKRDEWNAITIIIYSTFMNNKMVSNSYEEKANLYIQKPFNYDKTISMIKNVLSGDFALYKLPLAQNDNENYMKDDFPGRTDLYKT